MQCGENMPDKLKWCAKLKDGLKLIEPNQNLARSYLEQAKSSLKRAEKDMGEGDMLWATVVIYYAEYYALYSFLQRVGIKCENHFCSILAVEKLLGKEKVEIINDQKLKRIDAQYYMKLVEIGKIKEMLQHGKMWVAEFDNRIASLSEADVQSYRRKIKNLLK